jgi:hypothetical protein
MTRAKDAIYAFSPENLSRDNGISEVLRNAITSSPAINKSQINLCEYFNTETRVFEFGKIEKFIGKRSEKKDINSSDYQVTNGIKSLKLKLHAENYFARGGSDKLEKINYGKLMHEVFESIGSSDDVPVVLEKLVLEGKIPQEEYVVLEGKINSLISTQPASDWFMPGNNILSEAEILVPSGTSRRPDRIIFRDDKTIIIDFKFGDENPHHSNQVRHYRSLLNEMGYSVVEGFLWYVDKNLIVSV